ncbi:MAG: Regulatory sensor-transducer, BlaR1/MecR1 family, partial [Pedosphaera sp.]|nr:Regulatory sensor-transducer, BlaR1/MecR1 family [Pedosphaera sp.]
MNPSMVPWLQFIGLLALEGAVIVGIAAQLQRRIHSATWRRMVWHVCILSLLLLVVFEFTGTARGLAGWMSGAGALEGRGNIEHPTSNIEHRMGEAAFSPQPSFPMRDREKNGLPGIKYRSASTPAVKVEHGRTDAAHFSGNSAPLWAMLPGAIWMLGIAVVLGRVLFARVAFEIFRWRRREVDDVELRKTVRELALQLGIRRRVRLLESERICGPVAFGLLRPTIGLPVGFGKKFAAAQQEAMLAHELAHLAGNDAGWYLLADLVTAALWWHPLVWRARQQLQAASELAADEASLLVADGPSVLAECLVEIGTRLTQRRAFRQMGVEGNGFRSGLGRRVERLVNLEGNKWCPPNQFRC